MFEHDMMGEHRIKKRHYLSNHDLLRRVSGMILPNSSWGCDRSVNSQQQVMITFQTPFTMNYMRDIMKINNIFGGVG